MIYSVVMIERFLGIAKLKDNHCEYDGVARIFEQLFGFLKPNIVYNDCLIQQEVSDSLFDMLKPKHNYIDLCYHKNY